MSAHEVLKKDPTLSNKLAVSKELIEKQRLKRQEEDKTEQTKTNLLSKIRKIEQES